MLGRRIWRGKKLPDRGDEVDLNTLASAEPRRRAWPLAVGLGWLALGGAALGVGFALVDTGDYYSTLALAALALLFGVWVFWCHGGSRITAVGTYNLAFALFVGFAGVYQVLNQPYQIVKGTTAQPEAPLLMAVALCYFAHVLTWTLFWRGDPPAGRRPPEPRTTQNGAHWAIGCGILLLLGAVMISLNVEKRLPLVDSAGFVGVVLLGLGMLLGSGSYRSVINMFWVGGAFAAYFAYIFTGSGRIIIGSLGISLLVITTRSSRGRGPKLLLLLGAVPTLLFLAKLRAPEPGAPVSRAVSDQDGFGSAVGPLYSFAQLLDLDRFGMIPQEWGETFLAAVVALVPRAVWPSKPIGLGAELVPFLSPELVGAGHSDAALFYGEWVFNFGLVGLLFMIPATGFLVRGIDHLLSRASSLPLDVPHRIISYLAAVFAVAGMFDLVWVGTFTYVARGGSRILVLGALLVLVFLMRQPRSRSELLARSKQRSPVTGLTAGRS